MALAGTSQWDEWKRGWTLVLACAIGFSFFSVLLSGFGLFMGPLGAEFGWNKSTLSMGPAIATTVTALLSPFYGAMIDRFGSRRLALPGILVTIAGTGMFALANGSTTQWVLLWVAFGFILTSIKSTIWTTAVTGVFARGRGLALGLTLAGTALSQIVVPPLGNFLITEFGWRAAYVWLGLGWGGMAFVLCWLFLYDAHDRLARDPANLAGTRKRGGAHLPGLTKAQALRCFALWQVAISSFVVMLLTIGLGIHLFPIMTESGVPRETAAWLLSLAGVAGIVGKLVTGALLDRYRPNWTGGITMGITAVTFFVLIEYLHSLPMLVGALVINGYAAGSKTQITAFLTAGYAGLKNFGSIYGLMSAIVALASGLGPWIAGRVFDTMGGYEPFLWAGVVGSAIGGAILFTLPAFPQWNEEAEAEPFS